MAKKMKKSHNPKFASQLNGPHPFFYQLNGPHPFFYQLFIREPCKYAQWMVDHENIGVEHKFEVLS